MTSSCSRDDFPTSTAGRTRGVSAVQPLQFLHERFDPRSDVAPLGLPLTLLLAELPELMNECRGVVSLQLALQVLELGREFVALLLEPPTLVPELRDDGGGLLDALGEAFEVGLHDDGVGGHRSLSRPPKSLPTAATMRS